MRALIDKYPIGSDSWRLIFAPVLSTRHSIPHVFHSVSNGINGVNKKIRESMLVWSLQISLLLRSTRATNSKWSSARPIIFNGIKMRKSEFTLMRVT